MEATTLKSIEKYVTDNLRYDPDTGHFWWTKQKEKSTKRNMSKPAGYINNNGYWCIGFRFEGKDVKLAAHRLAWFFTYGDWPDKFVDHINRNKSDNRICNLRLATRAQNNANSNKRSKWKDSKCHSKYKGVTWLRDVQKWSAQATGGSKKLTYLGCFDSEEEAALAYNKHAIEVYGEYAKLNEVP